MIAIRKECKVLKNEIAVKYINLTAMKRWYIIQFHHLYNHFSISYLLLLYLIK